MLESEDDESMETDVACQTEKVELCDAECQTDKELTELTVGQRRELLELRKENFCLKEALEKKSSIDIFSEEFLMKEKNQYILKFYTGTYTTHVYNSFILMCTVTGFPEWILFNAFFKLVSPHLSDFQNYPWC